MRKRDLERYRKLLVRERGLLREQLETIGWDIRYSDTGAGQSELSHYDNHPGDTGTETFEKEKDVAIRDSYREILGRIDEAMGKIERGTYGECDRCGREIAKGRLDAVPYAIYCLECQDMIEGS